MDKERIENEAYKLLSETWTDATNGLDIVLLAKKLGFVVGNTVLPDNEDGFIIVDERKTDLLGTSSNKVIGVNTERDNYDKLFIVAHELGHYVLEGKEKPIYAHREKKVESRSEIEQEVDYFAASLLMPRNEFVARFSELSKDSEYISQIAEKLKQIFSAPYESVIRRLDELGLVGIAVSDEDI